MHTPLSLLLLEPACSYNRRVIAVDPPASFLSQKHTKPHSVWTCEHAHQCVFPSRERETPAHFSLKRERRRWTHWFGKRQTLSPLSHASTVSRRDRQVCCAFLFPPSPPPAVGGAKPRRDSCEQPVTSFSFREEPDLSAALLSFPHPPLLLLVLCLYLLLHPATGVKMMQEVSIMVAYDAHVVDRPGEEDTLARLVAHSRPLRTPRPVVGPFH